MTKNVYIAFLLVLGFLLGPMQTFASSMPDDMACCKKETMDMSCCKTDKQDVDMGCNNSCGSASCACPIVSVSPSVLFLQNETEAVVAFSEKKQNYCYAEILITSDFRSIWLPPKLA